MAAATAKRTIDSSRAAGTRESLPSAVSPLKLSPQEKARLSLSPKVEMATNSPNSNEKVIPLSSPALRMYDMYYKKYSPGKDMTSMLLPGEALSESADCDNTTVVTANDGVRSSITDFSVRKSVFTDDSGWQLDDQDDQLSMSDNKTHRDLSVSVEPSNFSPMVDNDNRAASEQIRSVSAEPTTAVHSKVPEPSGEEKKKEEIASKQEIDQNLTIDEKLRRAGLQRMPDPGMSVQLDYLVEDPFRNYETVYCMPTVKKRVPAEEVERRLYATPETDSIGRLGFPGREHKYNNETVRVLNRGVYEDCYFCGRHTIIWLTYVMNRDKQGGVSYPMITLPNMALSDIVKFKQAKAAQEQRAQNASSSTWMSYFQQRRCNGCALSPSST